MIMISHQVTSNGSLKSFSATVMGPDALESSLPSLFFSYIIDPVSAKSICTDYFNTLQRGSGLIPSYSIICVNRFEEIPVKLISFGYLPM